MYDSRDYSFDYPYVFSHSKPNYESYSEVDYDMGVEYEIDIINVTSTTIQIKTQNKNKRSGFGGFVISYENATDNNNSYTWWENSYNQSLTEIDIACRYDRKFSHVIPDNLT